MAKRKTQIDKAIAELDDKIEAAKIARDRAISGFALELTVLGECRNVLEAAKAAHATLKTSKAAKADDHVAKRTA